jgi:hypothetical protein
VDGELIKDVIREIEDVVKSDTKVKMKVLQKFGNSVDPMIRVTFATPCN